ncbi:cell division protein FtsQ/DivIB [Bacillus sp. B15-48]|uniref:cell division protein FtsQ/DivIB n=1 Tax=Bacillus sp. B15-48 TaxID=1548601 RepID=UPI00193FBE38|nr:cell division protein FtsQ/DivIB [Bacillus sp. B15-48]MBM4764019.1 FtsQ-type POTRA domain-containing protein [Bacillus sp. B15-48]
MENGKIVSIEERIPKLKEQRRKKANRRLIMMLMLFFTLILCIVYFQSPLSKVRTILVNGNETVSSDVIIDRSGITTDTNIWKINKEETAAKLEELSEIKTAEVSVSLPNSANIYVNEFKKLAYLSQENKFFPVLENGEIIQNGQTDDIPVNAPILFGFEEGEVLDGMVASLETLSDDILSSISEIHHYPSETDLYRILLYMNNGFEVNATIRSFSEKMELYPSIISQLDLTKTGVIDLEVGPYFKAHEVEEAEGIELEEKNEE